MWANPDSELWEWSFASVTLSVVLRMGILAAVSEIQSLPLLGSGICSEFWAFWKLGAIFRLFFFFSLRMRKSGGWLFRLDYYYFFAAFYRYGREKTLARLLSLRTMGGKAILQTLGSSCRAQISKDAVPLAVSHTALLWPCLITGGGREGSLSKSKPFITVRSSDICAGSALAAADKGVIRHPERKD